ncbi:LuxR family transcriptional regulator [Methylocystis echinoides]|jgi:LuxR family quorum sensing-dependent transcriptional regulator|uniref:LuxR family transcriptional regulator n=1 Tax=Methylocystis echinoides TaxID=29468 RepID=UPI0034362906
MTDSPPFSFDKASEALGQIKAARSLKDFEDVFLKIIGEIGYRYFVFGGIPEDGKNLGACIVSMHMPQGWDKLYFDLGFVDVDPVLKRCVASPDPFLWADVVAGLSVNSPEYAFMRKAEEHGLTHGVCFPVHGVNGLEAGVSLSGGAKAPSTTEMRNLHLFCLYAFNKLKSIAKGSAISVPALTKREREILLWSAFGKTNRQVAEILFLSEKTVATHFKKIIKKLSVQNKAEAIALALRAGLIPG